MKRDPDELFHSLRPKRLSDSAVDQILRLVKDGHLPVGAKLPPERELVTRLAVSRTSLREAIRILETMGVLRVVPGRGTWVKERDAAPVDGWFSWLPSHRQDVMQLLEMRETLEVKAAALAAERGGPEELQAIRTELDKMRAAAESNDREAMVAADTGLHDTIAVASGNRILAEVLMSLGQLVMDSRRALMSIPGRLQRVVRDHEVIVEAVLSRDPEKAARAMFQHVRRAAEEAAAAASMGVGIGKPEGEPKGGSGQDTSQAIYPATNAS